MMMLLVPMVMLISISILSEPDLLPIFTISFSCSAALCCHCDDSGGDDDDDYDDVVDDDVDDNGECQTAWCQQPD